MTNGFNDNRIKSSPTKAEDSSSSSNTKHQAELNLFNKALSILIVDDDLNMRTSLRELLAVYDMNSTLAKDGQDALEQLNNNHFDLVLLDINMPKKNGLQVMSEIHDHYSGTNMIILSGETSFKNAQKAMRMGADDFLNKPYNPSELIQLIHKIAEKKIFKSK
ncbi:MAG: response regulator [gamma proteobacterium symbiont of Bathyaustriella thionipta]|nr:response regulator [gamma proteobacterium symbiont of Bathyaustriella thionipta]MCU7951536.1 response regulator [gamma proteobacterium symbiont of Bathyaustriella thionipta]MCU7954456.1 response regulator [gamma proteobacterium symbiont of Bathyaustriella thionipta]MCU7958120.1 response regulator [gamma proteobacterium symbiont of Bathyaustriella thionipta]MCU7966336.1 response regulator [gamma proteobacterium symbiont of Bathyaustriella thionipta]